MTSVPSPILTSRGFTSPSEADILAGVQADQNAAFDGRLNPALDTPQGQLATSEAAVIGFCYDTFAYYVSQIDPATAQGRMQDAIGRIYFLERTPAEATVAACLCTGAPGVIIPTGALARAADGNMYACTGGGTIGAGGTVTLQFACTVTGPILCPANSITTIYQSVPGWDTVTNPADGVTGNDVETQYEFETRRAASVALNAVGSLPAIRANVLDVDNVLDAYVRDNDTGSSVTIGGVTIPAHSLYVAATGGTDADVARAIWLKKAPGCGTTGNTTVTVTDNRSGYVVPYPTYAIHFERPDALPILFAVEIANSVTVPADAETQIRIAILTAFLGADGGPRARIGGKIFASRFYAGVAALGAWAQIVSIQIGTSTPNADSLLVPIDKVPTLSFADITVTLV